MVNRLFQFTLKVLKVQILQNAVSPIVRLSRRPFTPMVTMLAIALSDSGAPPTEFRLFTKGWNITSKGRFLFDDTAAKSVMSDYAKHGVDLMIDLEHQSLDGASADPTARDARGWGQLELRNGDLWAVNVKWTPDGTARLTNKTQRYVSPAFSIDPETKRITSILNVAITSLPATDKTPALVAASSSGGTGMTIEEFMKVCKALGIDPTTPLDQAMAKIKGDPAADADNDPAAPPGDGTGGDGSSSDGTGPGAAASKTDPEGPPPADAKPKEVATSEIVTALAQLHSLDGSKSILEVLSKYKLYRVSHIELESGRQKNAKDRATIEAAERRDGCKKMVLAGRSPATVWSDDKATAPKKYLADMPIESFREFVGDVVKASSGTPRAPAPPATGGGDGGGAPAQFQGEGRTINVGGTLVELSSVELKICEQQGAKPEDYAALKMHRDGGK